MAYTVSPAIPLIKEYTGGYSDPFHLLFLPKASLNEKAMAGLLAYVRFRAFPTVANGQWLGIRNLFREGSLVHSYGYSS